MSLFFAVAAGATLGAASGLHCAAMCGPLAAATCSKSARLSIEYLLGRSLGYAVVGAVAGSLGAPLATGSAGGIVRIALALMVAALLVHRAASWLRPGLVQLRTQKPKPTRSFLSPVLALLPRRGVGLGLATAIFPCGALFGGVVAAAATGSGKIGALLMLAFSVASAPLLMAPALLGPRLSAKMREGTARRIGGALLLVVAAWVVAVPVVAMIAQPAKPSCCHRG